MWIQTILVNLSFFFGLLLICVCLYILHMYTYWRRRNVPYEKPEFLFGCTREILQRKKHYFTVFNSIYKKHPTARYVGMYTFCSPGLLIRDPNIVKAILTTNFWDFTTRDLLNTAVDPYTESILSMDANDLKWKTLRNTLDEALSTGKVRHMFETMVRCEKELVSYLKKYSESGQAVDLREVMSMFALDVFGAVALGVHCDSFQESWTPYRVLTVSLFAPKSHKTYLAMILSILLPDLLKFTLEFFRLKYFDPRVIKFHTNLWRQITLQRETETAKRDDMVDGIKDLMWKPGEKVDLTDRSRFNEEQAVGSMMALICAGYESSASMLSFAFYELSMNPHVQEKARSEVQRILQQQGGLTYEAILEMKYLGAVIDETLRMYPPITVLTRRSIRECKLPHTDLLLEKGTRVNMPITAILRDPAIFEEPDVFNPDRELTDLAKMLISLPFGSGPRICPGRRYSLIEGRVAIAAVLSKFRVLPAPDSPREIIEEPSSVFYLSKHPTLTIFEEIET